MNFQQIRAFVAVVDYGSLSKAAQALFVSEPTLSKQIRSLESSIGTPLLVRTNAGVTPTEAGKALLPKARDILHAVNSFELSAETIETPTAGHLSIGYVGTCYEEEIIAAAMEQIRRSAPDATLSVHLRENTELLSGLYDEEFDLIFWTAVEPLNDPQLRVDELGRPSIQLLVRDDHPFARRMAVSADELAGETILMIEERQSEPSVRYTRDFLRTTAGSEPRYAITASYNSVPLLVAAGQGIAFINTWQRADAAKRLVSVPLSGAGMTMTVSLASLCANKNQLIGPFARFAQQFASEKW